MPDNVFPVDTGVAAFVTLVGLTAYMVEHVLLGERHRDSGLGLRFSSCHTSSVPTALELPWEQA